MSTYYVELTKDFCPVLFADVLTDNLRALLRSRALRRRHAKQRPLYLGRRFIERSFLDRNRNYTMAVGSGVEFNSGGAGTCVRDTNVCVRAW